MTDYSGRERNEAELVFFSAFGFAALVFPLLFFVLAAIFSLLRLG
jgi:hypothetical protein